MRKRTSDYSSDTEPPQQPPQRDNENSLRCPLTTPATFLDAKIAFDNGGDEVRRFLVQECTLIFECNACRNMFRDLKNFISHKRFYCCVNAPITPCNGSIGGGGGGSGGGGGGGVGVGTSNNSNGFPDPKSNALIAATAALAINAVHNGRFSSSSSVESADVGVADVLYDEHQNAKDELMMELNDGSAEGQATSRQQVEKNMALVECAEKAADASIAESKLPDTEMNDVHSLITKMENDLSDALPQLSPQLSEEAANVIDDQTACAVPQFQSVPGKMKHPCGMCNMEFQTDKSLKIHMHKKHMASAHTFKCPSCALTFMQPAAVIRHLATDHKKSVRRIRMTRDTKRRLHSEESQARGAANRELRRLQSTDSNAHESDVAEKKKVMSNCIYCEKSFERRAALSTHLMSCRVKLEALEKPPPIKRSKLHSSLSVEQPTPEAHQQPIADDVTEAFIGQQTSPIDTSEEEPKEHDQNDVDDDDDHEEELQPIVIKKECYSHEDNPSFESEYSTVSKVDADDDSPAAMNNALAEAEAETKQEATVDDATEKLEEMPNAAEEQVASNKDEPAESDGAANAKNKSKELSCRCKICNKQFNALSNLRRHISMFHYRARKFGCTLCEYRAFRRYDIVNHLGFVHKMTDNREMLATEYVSVHEVHYSKDDMDGDIVVLSEEQKDALSAAEATSKSSGEKRSKRIRTTLSNGQSAVANDVADGASKPLRQKLRRSTSTAHASLHEAHDGIGNMSSVKSQKRPIRNRIKPENKDFVYDLSTLLKGESAAAGGSGVATTESGGGGGGGVGAELRSSLKRRHTGHHGAAGGDLAAMSRKSLAPLISSECRELVKSSTRRICLLMVSQGRAKLATQPELPAERPQMRTRLPFTCRMDMQVVPVIETSDLEAARRKSTLLEDSFLEKISRRTASEFKIKPCLELEHTALDTLLQKVDSSLQQQQQLLLQQQQQKQQQQEQEQQQQQQQDEQEEEQEQKFLIGSEHDKACVVLTPLEANNAACKDMEMAYLQNHTIAVEAPAPALKTALTSPPLAKCAITQSSSLGCLTASLEKSYFISPLPSIPVASSPPSTPRKRITLVQRMAENRKQRESLLRTALEN